jgi:hypothetical protein
VSIQQEIRMWTEDTSYSFLLAITSWGAAAERTAEGLRLQNYNLNFGDADHYMFSLARLIHLFIIVYMAIS